MGKLTEEEVDIKIDEWDKNYSKLTVWEYLGWSKEDYVKYLNYGTIPSTD